MNQQTEKLCDILEPLSAGPAFDVFPLGSNSRAAEQPLKKF